MVFKAISGVSDISDKDLYVDDPYELWVSSSSYNENITEARQLNATFKGHYKSSFVLDWEERDVSMVRK